MVKFIPGNCDYRIDICYQAVEAAELWDSTDRTLHPLDFNQYRIKQKLKNSCSATRQIKYVYNIILYTLCTLCKSIYSY